MNPNTNSTNNRANAPTTNAQRNNRRKQPEAFVEVPLRPRRGTGGIGNLVKGLSGIRVKCKTTAGLYLRLEEDLEKSTDTHCTGHVKIASRDQAAVTNATCAVQALLQDLDEKANRRPNYRRPRRNHRRSPNDGNDDNDRITSQAPVNALQIAMELALKKSTKSHAKAAPAPAPVQAQAEAGWTTVQIKKKTKSTEPSKPKPSKPAKTVQQPVQQPVPIVPKAASTITSTGSCWTRDLSSITSIKPSEKTPDVEDRKLALLEKSVRALARKDISSIKMAPKAAELARPASVDAWDEDGDDILCQYDY